MSYQYQPEKKDAKKNQVPYKIINNMLIGECYAEEYLHIGNWILKAFKCRPKFIGQIDAETEEKVTYEEMRDKSVKLAIWLKKYGIKENDVVTICTRNRMQAYIPLLASIYLHLYVNPWDYSYLNDSVRTFYFLLQDNPDVIFIDSENFIKLKMTLTLTRCCEQPILTKIIVMDGVDAEYESLDSILNNKFDPLEIEEFECVPHTEKSTAVEMFSCNTASYPGEVSISYGMFLAESNDETPILKPYDVGLWYEPINWTYSLLLTIRVILYYVTAIKMSTFDEENLCQVIEKYKVSWVFLKSDMCNQFNNTNVFKKYNVSSLKQVLFGDTEIIRPIHEGFIQSLPNVLVSQVYGLTETGVIAYQRETGKIGSSGKVSKNVRVLFIDFKTRQPVSAHTHGEIWCQTSYMKAVSDPVKSLESKYDLRRTSQRWYFTGDVGYYDEDGDIFVTDKLRDMIKYRGRYISPKKVEAILLRHPDVHEAVVVGVWDEIDGQHAKAFVIKEEKAKTTQDELITFVENNINDENYLLHGGLSFITSIPYLPNGRVDRVKIKYIPCENE